MKKTMIASAVIFSALAGVCDVTSANVVGFANKTWAEAAKFQMVCTQFQKIGVKAEDMTMADLVPAGNWTENTDTVKVFADNSTVEIELVYIGEGMIEQVRRRVPEAVIGWYQKGTKTYSPCYNSKKIPAGSGFMAYANKAGSTIEIPTAL